MAIFTLIHGKLCDKGLYWTRFDHIEHYFITGYIPNMLWIHFKRSHNNYYYYYYYYNINTTLSEQCMTRQDCCIQE